MERMRIVRIMGSSFAGLIAVLAIVLVVLSGDWTEPDDDLAALGMVVTGFVGLLGLGVVLWWRNRITARPVPASKLMNGFLITAAFAETGMLLGFVLALGSQRTAPFWLGAAIFAVGLFLLTTGLSQAEIEDSGTPQP